MVLESNSGVDYTPHGLVERALYDQSRVGDMTSSYNEGAGIGSAYIDMRNLRSLGNSSLLYALHPPVCRLHEPATQSACLLLSQHPVLL